MGYPKKLLSLILCAMLVLSLVFSISFISHEAGHDCSGEECQICAVISHCAEILERLLAVASLALFFGALLVFVCRASDSVSVSLGEQSPVKLKVKLSN